MTFVSPASKISVAAARWVAETDTTHKVVMVAAVMAKLPKRTEHCTYRQIKVDDELVDLVAAAARLSGQTMQEWASDLLNTASAAALNRPPVARRPPPNPPHGKGRAKG